MMKRAILVLAIAAAVFAQPGLLNPWMAPSGGTAGSVVIDTLTVNTDVLRVNDSAGFFGATPKARCTLSHGTPPNPVTAAQARSTYDLSMQNCLTGFGLVGTP